MTKKVGFILMLVLGYALASIAVASHAHRVFDKVSSLPEASTLGLLGTGLVGFALLIRRRMKLELNAA